MHFFDEKMYMQIFHIFSYFQIHSIRMGDRNCIFLVHVYSRSLDLLSRIYRALDACSYSFPYFCSVLSYDIYKLAYNHIHILVHNNYNKDLPHFRGHCFRPALPQWAQLACFQRNRWRNSMRCRSSIRMGLESVQFHLQ